MLVTRFSLRFLAIVGLLTVLLIGATMAAGVALRGDELAYVSYHDLYTAILLVDVDHGLMNNLTQNDIYDADPAWSPDGNWLAFTSNRDGKRDIYLMDALGGSLRRLTDGSHLFAAPRWLADGKRLIFTALDEGSDAIYRVNADGSGLKRLTDPANPKANISIDLALDPANMIHDRSPDGSRIAFMAYRDQGWAIYLSQNEMHQNARLLVTLGSFTEAPVWSPNGKRLAYLLRGDRSTSLYVINVDDGTAPRRLTYDLAVDTSPVWRP